MNRHRTGRGALAVILAGLVVVAGGAAIAGGFARHHHTIQSSTDSAAHIYLREKLPAGRGARTMGKAILFVHGATYPGTSFDLPVPGYNWTDYVAERGYAAYYLDVRGYGLSTRPPAMAAPAANNPPFMRAADAIRDISDAVQFIRERAGVERVALVGWSWGTVTAGMYTAAHNDMVHKLVLYAPVYAVDRPQLLRRFKLADPNDAGRFNPAIGAYRTITAAAARGRWEAQIVPEDKDLWREDRVFRTWFAEIQATDPLGAAANPAYVRAPNGVLVDVFEIFSNRPVYDAKAITVPTLIIRGADDPTATDDDARGLLARLGAADKSYRILPDGSHFISLEREGARIFDAVQEFLDR